MIEDEIFDSFPLKHIAPRVWKSRYVAVVQSPVSVTLYVVHFSFI